MKETIKKRVEDLAYGICDGCSEIEFAQLWIPIEEEMPPVGEAVAS